MAKLDKDLHFRVDEQFLKDLGFLVQKSGMSKSDVVRWLVKHSKEYFFLKRPFPPFKV